MIGIIPAAGRGVRFKELGKQYPKAILPYNNVPILVLNVEKLLRVCDEIRVIVNHQWEKIDSVIQQYFPTEKDKVKLVHQKSAEGLSDAVLAGIQENEDEEVFILLGDLYLGSDPEDVLTRSANFISVKPVPDYSRWCMVQRDQNNYVSALFDKPKAPPLTDLAVSGVYKFSSSKQVRNLILEQKQKDARIKGEFQISYVIEHIEKVEANEEVSILDFGTLEEYLENKNTPLSRNFNNIHINKNTVTKSSKDRDKMISEYLWFNNLPDELKIYTPHTFSSSIYEGERASYSIEKILAPTLRDVFLFLDYSTETWSMIIDGLFDFIKKEQSYQTSVMRFFFQDATKCKKRVASLPGELMAHPKFHVVKEFLSRYESYALNVQEYDTVMHGDLCFSNILYDLQSSKFKVIDPRGSLFGSYKYDLAKLFHSIIYPYDFIDTDLYSVDQNFGITYYDSGREDIRELFLDKFAHTFGEDSFDEIRLITASLYLSMIPIHSHSKQHQRLFFEVFLKISKEIGID